MPEEEFILDLYQTADELLAALRVLRFSDTQTLELLDEWREELNDAFERLYLEETHSTEH